MRVMYVPKEIFFTKGVGVHKDHLASFELALRKAGIEKCNLVYVSSIFPPKCKQITRSCGLRKLAPGAITFCVMARNETKERKTKSAIFPAGLRYCSRERENFPGKTGRMVTSGQCTRAPKRMTVGEIKSPCQSW